jgi:hypothetical protein
MYSLPLLATVALILLGGRELIRVISNQLSKDR